MTKMNCRDKTKPANNENTKEGGGYICLGDVKKDFFSGIPVERLAHLENMYYQVRSLGSPRPICQCSPEERTLINEFVEEMKHLKTYMKGREANRVIKNTDGTLTIQNIRPKRYCRASSDDDRLYNAHVVPNQSIRVQMVSISEFLEYDRTFKVGDRAAYGSHNTIYMGKIVGISDKTVTIQPDGSNKKIRMNLWEFCWRNHAFNHDDSEWRNSKWMD